MDDADVPKKVVAEVVEGSQQARQDALSKFQPLKDGEIRVMLGVPGGGTLRWETAKAIFMATKQKGRYGIFDSMYSNGNFNALWADALNFGAEKRFSHFVMIHTDINPGLWWLEMLLEEITKQDAALVSVASAIKDPRGLTSSGVGDPNDRWRPYRRFTVQELTDTLPETFTAEDIGYGDKYLLHNHGLMIVDLRKPVWQQMRKDGHKAPAFFVYDEEVYFNPKTEKWERRVESEDWYFSRMLAQTGAKTCITNRIKNIHHGGWIFLNWGKWGTYDNGDDDTADKWRHLGEIDPISKKLMGKPPARTPKPPDYVVPAEVAE